MTSTQRWRYIGVVFPGNVPAAIRVWRRDDVKPGELRWANDEGEPYEPEDMTAPLFLTRNEAYTHAEQLCAAQEV
jgi:hypothetical protein